MRAALTVESAKPLCGSANVMDVSSAAATGAPMNEPFHVSTPLPVFAVAAIEGRARTLPGASTDAGTMAFGCVGLLQKSFIRAVPMDWKYSMVRL